MDTFGSERALTLIPSILNSAGVPDLPLSVHSKHSGCYTVHQSLLCVCVCGGGGGGWCEYYLRW